MNDVSLFLVHTIFFRSLRHRLETVTLSYAERLLCNIDRRKVQWICRRCRGLGHLSAGSDAKVKAIPWLDDHFRVARETHRQQPVVHNVAVVEATGWWIPVAGWSINDCNRSNTDYYQSILIKCEIVWMAMAMGPFLGWGDLLAFKSSAS